MLSIDVASKFLLQELAAIVIFVFLLSTLLIYIISILGTSPQTFEEAVRQQRQTGFDLNDGAATKANAAAKKKEKERARKERKRAEAGGGTPKAEKPVAAEAKKEGKKKKKEKAAAAAAAAAAATAAAAAAAEAVVEPEVVETVPITTDESHDEG